MKRFLFLTFLAVTSFGVGAVAVPSVAQATGNSAQDLINLLDARIQQLEDEAADLLAIINDPNSTTGEVIAAEGARQQCLFRIAQAQAIQANANFFDHNTIDFLYHLFQEVVSENAPKLGTT